MPDDSTRDNAPLKPPDHDFPDHLHCLLCPRTLDPQTTVPGVVEVVRVLTGNLPLEIAVDRPLCPACAAGLERKAREVAAAGKRNGPPRLIVPRGRG
jgi:hypothetical protein